MVWYSWPMECHLCFRPASIHPNFLAMPEANELFIIMIDTWEDTQGLHCKYPRELHTIPYNFVIRNWMELSRRLFLISLGAADFVTYDQREVFLPTPFCQENVIIWKQNRPIASAGRSRQKLKTFLLPFQRSVLFRSCFDLAPHFVRRCMRFLLIT